MATYSFLNVQGSISGPGGDFLLGNGSGSAEEGITVAQGDDKNTMTIGADGQGMHSLHAGKSGTVTVRLLKTSPVNAQLAQMYNLQTANAALHGSNQISIRDSFRGDVLSCSGCAFKKFPDVTYAKDGNTLEWEFDAISIDPVLGFGTPSRI